MIVVLDNGMKLRPLDDDDAQRAVTYDRTFEAETLETHELDRKIWRVVGSHVAAMRP